MNTISGNRLAGAAGLVLALFLVLPAVAAFGHVRGDIPLPSATGMPQLAGAGDVSFSFKVSPEMLPADGKTEADIVVALKGKDGKPLADRRVSFYLESGYGRLTPTFPVTDDDGNAEASYVAGRTATTAIVRVTDETTGETARVAIPTSISASINLELVEPSRFISSWIKRQMATQLYTMDVDLFPDRLVADGFSTSRVTVHLFSLDGTAASGVPLQINLLSGGGEIIRDRRTTDAFGSLEAFYRAGDTPGTAIIEVVEPVTGLSKVVELPILEAGPARIKLFYTNKEGLLFQDAAKLPADGLSTITVVAQVLNLVDMPVPGVELRFSLGEDLGVIEVLNPRSDPEGRVFATFKAGTRTGKETITAFLTSKPPADILGG